jgi:hypothetical protein
MERRKFTREFKLEAVRLIRERGVSYTSAATDCLSRTKYLELPEPRMPYPTSRRHFVWPE